LEPIEKSPKRKILGPCKATQTIDKVYQQALITNTIKKDHNQFLQEPKSRKTIAVNLKPSRKLERLDAVELENTSSRQLKAKTKDKTKRMLKSQAIKISRHEKRIKHKER